MKKITSLLAILLFTGWAGATQAAPVVQIDGTGTNATGILNLEVDGTPYNVEFVYDFGDNVYPSGFPFTGGDEFTANTAIIVALNGSPAETVGPETGNSYVLGADISPIPPLTVGPGATFLAGSWESDPAFLIPDDERATYAEFSAVPLPAAAWLFGSGVLGLVGLARKRRKV
jgi:hypothetical protein